MYQNAIDAEFKDEQIRRGLKMVCRILAAVDEVHAGQVHPKTVTNAIADAMYCTTNNPFLLTFHGMLRSPFMVALKHRVGGGAGAVDVFLDAAIPLVKSLENGKEPSSYME